MCYIDSHAHLDQIENVDAAMTEAAQAGVAAVIAVGVHHASNQKNLEIKSRIHSPRIFVGLGLHPGEIKTEEINETLAFIRAHPNEAVAIGEIGLDFWYRWVRKNDEKKEEQRRVFRQQLAMAKEFNLPVVIHSRGAWKECLDIVGEYDLPKVLFHWYSGPQDVLKNILDKGYLISATPALMYSPELIAAVKFAPVSQTVIETDSPVFYKEGEGGFNATPKDVCRTFDLYASIKDQPREELAKTLYTNTCRFFALDLEG